jgi:cob(I)alamin adenosyltransferase
MSNDTFQIPNKSGFVYVFTGEGKGKTSAAIGVAVRAAGAGMKVAWVGWYKQESWGLSELTSFKKLGITVHLLGKGFHIANDKYQMSNTKVKTVPVGKNGQVVVDVATETEHMQAARAAFEKARELLGTVDLLVLDEVNNAVFDGLIDLADFTDLISGRGKTHLVLTGRDAHEKIVEIADLVTEMKKVKHPYDKGKLAVKGLDF